VRAEGLRSYVCVPLLRGQRRMGILEVFARTPGRFDLDDVALLELVAAFVAPLLELSDLERHLQSLQNERASSFREWSAQLAAAADAERTDLGAALVATAAGWAEDTTTVQRAAEDVLRLSDGLRTRTGFQFDLVPLVRANLVGRLAQLHEIDVDLRLDEWPATLPSGLTSRLYLVVLALAEEAAAVAHSSVRLIFTSDEDALAVEIHDDREAPPGGIQVLPVPPDVLNAVRHLGGSVDFVDPADSASAGVRVVIPRRRLDALGDTLTLRERAVLECLRRGRSNRELATELGISPKTLQNHLTALYRKLGVTSRAEAIRYAERAGMPSGQRVDSSWEGSHG
jgi:DNA-binding CsgD family transcriptional regulator